MVIHGFIVSGHESLMPWAADKLSERALILPDLMGYGYSGRDTKPGDWSTPKSHARYLAAMLDHLGVAKVDIVGHSYGSAIAAQFALDYPQRVRRIVFMSPGLYIERSATEVLIQWPVHRPRHGLAHDRWRTDQLRRAALPQHARLPVDEGRTHPRFHRHVARR